MKPHIIATITDIKTRIAELQTACQLLEQFDAITERGSATVFPEPRPQPAVPASVHKAQPPARIKSPRLVATNLNESVLRKISEPFTIADFVKHSGLTRAAAGSAFTRWQKAEFIKRVGHGKYVRADLFNTLNKLARPTGTARPAKKRYQTDEEIAQPATPAPAPAPAPTPARPSKRELSEKMADALKARDHAIAHGNDKLATIHQTAIDQLDAQLQ